MNRNTSDKLIINIYTTFVIPQKFDALTYRKGQQRYEYCVLYTYMISHKNFI